MFERPSPAHALLVAAAVASGVTLALALRSGPALVLAVAIVPAVALRLGLPPLVGRELVGLARVAAGATAIVGFVVTVYPVVPENLLLAAAAALGHLQVLLLAILLVARTPPAGGAVLAVLGTLVCASIPPEPASFRVAGSAAALALVAWLGADTSDGRRVRPVPMLLFTVAAAAIAAGISWALPVAQPKVEQAVAEMITGGEATTGLALESRLGDVAKLARSTKTALRAWTDHPQDLRVRAFTSFDGRAWRVAPEPAAPLVPIDVPAGRWPERDDAAGRDLALPGAPLATSLTSTRIVVRAPERGAMPAPPRVRVVRVADSDVDVTPGGILMPSLPAAHYAVLHDEDETDHAEPGAGLLSLPETLDPRLPELARRIGEGLSPAERVERTIAHFHDGYRYTLDVGEFRTGDPLAEFVFDKRAGYCEYFASATVMLLRLQGVPARYVTGYAVRPFQRAGDHYLVRDSDAHAWAEAWVAGRGWIEADATPPGDYAALHGSVDAGFWERVSAAWDELVASFRQGGITALAHAAWRRVLDHPLIAAALLLAAIAAFVRGRLPRRSRGHRTVAVADADPLGPGLRGLVERVDRLCASRGAPRPSARTPREHAADPRLRLGDDERATCLDAVGVVYAETFGGRPHAAEHVVALSARLDAFAAAQRNEPDRPSPRDPAPTRP